MENFEYFKNAIDLILSTSNEDNIELGYSILTNCENIEELVHKIVYGKYLKGEVHIVNVLQNISKKYEKLGDELFNSYLINKNYLTKLGEKLGTDVSEFGYEYIKSIALKYSASKGGYKYLRYVSRDVRIIITGKSYLGYKVNYELEQWGEPITNAVFRLKQNLEILEKCSKFDVLEFFLGFDDNKVDFEYWKGISVVANKIGTFLENNSQDLRELALEAKFNTMLKAGLELGDSLKLRIGNCTYCKVFSIDENAKTAHVLYHTGVAVSRYHGSIKRREVKKQSYAQLFKKIKTLL